MVLQLSFNDFLRMRGAQGADIEVLDGHVWITEDGRGGDRFMGAGQRYRVAGTGLVVVGAEAGGCFARVQVKRRARGPVAALRALMERLKEAWHAERTRQELAELSDRTLRDIGLSRGDIHARFR